MKKLILVLFISLATLPAQIDAQTVDSGFLQNLQWRMIGPFRAGRTVGATGIPDQPGVFFMGVNNGGVWKTDDFGRTWNPIFDDAPTGSVGDIAVALSNPDVIYVGTGEGLHRPDLAVGDGMFKSTDGGQSWRHIGLGDAQQIAGIAVHPDNENLLFVAVLGHPYGPNEERGLYKSADGGNTWERSLYFDENTGAFQVMFDPSNSDILLVDMWAHREGPWENGAWTGTTSGLFKSTDSGDNWTRLDGGLPSVEQGLGRIGFDISRSNPNVYYATVDARTGGGIYRSDNAGETWTLTNTDRRLWGRGGDFGELKVHPEKPDVVFAGNIASYRTDDGGHSWTSIKGAPGGDDYHRIWINPNHPDIMIFAADQGATITVNGGRTWSSWYNQPTTQLYHVATDNQFPYWIYGGQQESGAIAVMSRSNGGQTSFREWHGVGADEYAYVAPDPLNPDIIYGGRVVKFNRRTGQTQNIAPESVRSGDYRILRSMPLLFSEADPHTLFFATNVLWKTTTGGDSWEIISPDLSNEKPDVPESVGIYRTTEMADMPRRGVIYSVGPSPLDVNVIWAGTDDGLMHVTFDGGARWQNVTPPELRAWDKVSQADAGHFDTQTAYIAVNAIRRDDMRPHVFRTHDGGQTWDEIVNGLPDNGPINVVREDPKQPGLLYAGSERETYVSLDDGENWQSLRLNMPATSIRDLVIHKEDVVVGTHGRSIWILDNVESLRQMSSALAASDVYLVAPPPAFRVRWNMYSDTPLPPEEPTGENPPDGAMIDYVLKKSAREVTLELLDAQGEVVRIFSSSDEIEQLDSTLLPHPTYWIRPPEHLKTTQGSHRFVWDLRYTPPKDARRSYSIAAVYRKTPSAPHGPWVFPGTYTVRLNVDGQSYTQPLEVRLDPRVEITDDALQLQHNLSLTCYTGYNLAQEKRESVVSILGQIAERLTAQIPADLEASLKGFQESAESISGNGVPRSPDIVYSSVYKAPEGTETLVGLQTKYLYLLNIMQSADAKPTQQMISGVNQMRGGLEHLMERWTQLRMDSLNELNTLLEAAGLRPLVME